MISVADERELWRETMRRRRLPPEERGPTTPRQRELDRARRNKWRELHKDELIQFQVTMDREENDELKAMAAKQGVSKVALVRQYITWGLENDTS